MSRWVSRNPLLCGPVGFLTCHTSVIAKMSSSFSRLYFICDAVRRCRNCIRLSHQAALLRWNASMSSVRAQGSSHLGAKRCDHQTHPIQSSDSPNRAPFVAEHHLRLSTCGSGRLLVTSYSSLVRAYVMREAAGGWLALTHGYVRASPARLATLFRPSRSPTRERRAYPSVKSSLELAVPRCMCTHALARVSCCDLHLRR